VVPSPGISLGVLFGVAPWPLCQTTGHPHAAKTARVA
jgi:hypothetical protein